MLKLLKIAILCVSFSFAEPNFYDFLIKSYQKNEKILVSNLKTTKILPLDNGFSAYFVNLELKIPALNKQILKKEILFIKGDLVVSDIINLKTKSSLRDELTGEKISISFMNLNKGLKYENNQNCK